jgi:hypothetical protein
MHARTRRSHAPKPKLGEICIVSWRGREPSRMPKTSPHRQLRRTPNASTRTFGHSSARSNRRDAVREASCTSMASSVSDLPTAVGLPHNQPRTALCTRKLERQGRDVLPVDSSCFWSALPLRVPWCLGAIVPTLFLRSKGPRLSVVRASGQRLGGIVDGRRRAASSESLMLAFYHPVLRQNNAALPGTRILHRPARRRRAGFQREALRPRP